MLWCELEGVSLPFPVHSPDSQHHSVHPGLHRDQEAEGQGPTFLRSRSWFL